MVCQDWVELVAAYHLLEYQHQPKIIGAPCLFEPLRNVRITRPDRVWAADISSKATRLHYLVMMAWNSRYLLAWRLSNALETGFCSNTKNSTEFHVQRQRQGQC